MIIAWGLFIFGIFFSLIGIFNLRLYCKNIEQFKEKYDFAPTYNTVWASMIIALCSAQYIWG